MAPDKKQAIAEHLLAEIAAGRLTSGDKAPTEIALAKKFDTSLASAHRAMKRLEDMGMLVRLRKKGSFVSAKANAETAGDLRQGVTRKVYALLPKGAIPEAHWGDAAMAEFERVVKADGVKVVYRRFSQNGNEEALREFYALIEAVVNDGAAGIALGAFHRLPLFVNKTRHLIAERNIPLLIHNISGEAFPDLLCDMVSHDPYADGVKLGETVARLGYRQAFFIGSREFTKPHYLPETSWLSTRVRGVRFGFGAENGDAAGKTFQFLTTEDDFGEVVARIRAATEKTAVIAVNAIVAGKFIDFAAANGVSAPNAFGLVAFDDHPAARHYNITALAAPIPKIGALMGNLLREKLAGGPQDYRHWIKVSYELVERETMKIR